ncbi:TIGR04222 domain-containing membrane protein [Dactylosporangium sp. NPDC005555]|uniref:TIGR04222 domain-containing membrane protein n=1 Tax=Dactylosporangium sp. NPDC005555 TaxID=3154889 RepID=UPI0033B97B0E
MVGLDPRDLGGARDLITYVVVVLLAWLVAVALRAMLRGGGGPALDREPGPEHVAYLTGGPLQALYASVAALRSTGSVQAAGDAIHTGGPAPRGGGELAAAVHHAARGGMAVRGLPSDPAVRAVLDRTGEQLRGQGALLSPGRRLAMRLTSVPLFVLAVFGVARFALNLPTGDTPDLSAFVVALLTVFCALAALFAGIVLAAMTPIRTRRADRVVHDLRRRHDALAPRHNPSLTGNGPAAATLAVGLFGIAVLWTADPAFARAANVFQQRTTGSGGYRGDRGVPYSDESSCSSG